MVSPAQMIRPPVFRNEKPTTVEFGTCRGCYRREPHGTRRLYSFECFLSERLWAEKHKELAARIEMDELFYENIRVLQAMRDIERPKTPIYSYERPAVGLNDANLSEHARIQLEMDALEAESRALDQWSQELKEQSEAIERRKQAFQRLSQELDVLSKEADVRREKYDKIEFEISRLEANMDKLEKAKDPTDQKLWIQQLLQETSEEARDLHQACEERERRERPPCENNNDDEDNVACIKGKGSQNEPNDHLDGSAPTITPNVVRRLRDAAIKTENNGDFIPLLAEPWTKPLPVTTSKPPKKSLEGTYSGTAATVLSGPRRTYKTEEKSSRYQPYPSRR